MSPFYGHKSYKSTSTTTEKAIGGSIIVIGILSVLSAIAMPVVIIWGIIKLVSHFTG